MLDDAGFGDTSTFGGAAQTPALTKLAESGLRYNRFHTTGLCSPTRAALLGGRNHHRMSFGAVGEAGYPGYNGIWKQSTGSVVEILRRAGYSTAAFGKWHNTPFREISPVGPFDRWPTSLGFEYYYGNMLGASSQWQPELWRNTVSVHQPQTAKDGYHYTTDIANEAIRWISTHRSLALAQPYLMYVATGAVHGPAHVPTTWIEQYKGRFDQGWDALRKETFARQKKLGVVPKDARLPPSPKELPRWDNMSAAERRFASHQMEVYAGFLSHTDHEIGRLLDAVMGGPGGENTLIFYIVGDNGASGEVLNGGAISATTPPRNWVEQLSDLGGPKYYSHYAAGWAIASNTPFKWAKGVASHLGATRNPLVVSWPKGIPDGGGLRPQFVHVNDIASTILEVAGLSMPNEIAGTKQVPLDGVSFAYSFDSPHAPSRHRRQYFETWGNRAMYEDGWIAAARHRLPWKSGPTDHLEPMKTYASDKWELYNLDEDFTQSTDLSRKHPERLERLRILFDAEAAENNIYPLISGNLYGKMPPTETKRSFVFSPGTAIPSFNGPQFPTSDRNSSSRSFRIEADVHISNAETTGVLVSQGTRYFGGFAFYVRANHLIYEQKNQEGQLLLSSQAPIPRGDATLALEFVVPEDKEPCAAIARLYIDHEIVAESAVQGRFQNLFGIFGVGEAFGPAVSEFFEPPYKFTGELRRVKVELR